MIGIGTWACKVDTMFFKGEVKFKIYDDNGKYGFDMVIDGPVPKFEIKNVTESNGNTLSAIGTVEMLPGKEIEGTLTFNGDKFEGVLKVPFLGKIKLKDGWKVA